MVNMSAINPIGIFTPINFSRVSSTGEHVSLKQNIMAFVDSFLNLGQKTAYVIPLSQGGNGNQVNVIDETQTAAALALKISIYVLSVFTLPLLALAFKGVLRCNTSFTEPIKPKVILRATISDGTDLYDSKSVKEDPFVNSPPKSTISNPDPSASAETVSPGKSKSDGSASGSDSAIFQAGIAVDSPRAAEVEPDNDDAEKFENSQISSREKSPFPEQMSRPAAEIMKITENFGQLCQYISSKYPDFDVSPYKSIESLQKEGHPFHFAAKNNDIALLKALVEAGVDIHQRDENENTTLDILMKKYEVFSNEHLQIAFKKGVPDQDKEMIIYLIEAGLRIDDSYDIFGKPSIERLIEACVVNDEEWIFDLIKSVANRENIAGITHAILENSALSNKIVKDLFEKELSANALDRVGRSLLYKAVDRMDKDLVTTLIEHDADPSLARKLGGSIGAKTPLDLALSKQTQLNKLKGSGALLDPKFQENLNLCNEIVDLLRVD